MEVIQKEGVDIRKHPGAPDASLSVVIPVYNSAAGLALLAERLAPVLAALSPEHEAILVNDGSSDASWEVIAALHETFGWLRGINLMRNYGQHSALLCGIRAAQYDVIVTMDDDLQHPPEEIPKLLAVLAQGFDVVYGTPEREEHGFMRDLASVATK